MAKVLGDITPTPCPFEAYPRADAARPRYGYRHCVCAVQAVRKQAGKESTACCWNCVISGRANPRIS